MLILILLNLPEHLLVFCLVSLHRLHHIEGLFVAEKFHFFFEFAQPLNMGIEGCDERVHRADNFFQLGVVDVGEDLRLDSAKAVIHHGDYAAEAIHILKLDLVRQVNLFERGKQFSRIRYV